MGEEVGQAEGEAQRGDTGDHQVRHDPTQVQVPEAKSDLGTLHYLGVSPDSVLVELLYGFFEPPIRSHEGQCHCDLGVHCSQGPVLGKYVSGYLLKERWASVNRYLPEKVDWALMEGHPDRGEDHQL